MKTLSIIIVTYKSLKDIVPCLNSIYMSNNLHGNDLEIIIVDNSPVEIFHQMKALLEGVFGHAVLLIHNSKNGGYGQGNNVGIAYSTADYVLIANPDIILQRPIFDEALKLFKKDDKLALIGGKQLGGKNISFWNLPEFDFFIFTAPVSILFNKIGLYSERLFYLSGALLFINKKKFHEIGLFDEKLFMYCEEADISRRFRERGYRTKYVKKFVYKHLVDERDDVSETSFDRLMRSTQYYLDKFGFSYRKFLKRKIYSYEIMQLMYSMAGKKEHVRKTAVYLSRFKNMYKNRF